MRPQSADPKGPSRTVLKLLFAVSRNVCAFPGCSTPVADLASEEIICEVCHIRGKPGGPRYDPTQTNSERHGAKNLILLCGVHHKIVDEQYQKYTVETLLEYKRQSEDSSGPGLQISDRMLATLFQALREHASPTATLNNSPGSIVNIGPSIEEVRQIALDIYHANAYSLIDTARDVAEKRAQGLINKSFDQLRNEGISPAPLLQPDMQYALAAAARAAARRGGEASDMLVDLLVERVKSTDDLATVVLSEAIDVAAKLTSAEFDILSLLHVIRGMKMDLMTRAELDDLLECYVAPLLPPAEKLGSRFQHLHYSGGIAAAPNPWTLEELIGSHYPHVFLVDIPRAQIVLMLRNRVTPQVWGMFRPGKDKDSLTLLPWWLAEMQALLSDFDPKRKDAHKHPYSAYESLRKLAAGMVRREAPQAPCFQALRFLWNKYGKTVILTSVGLALAIANLRRRGLLESHFSDWME